MSHDLMTDPLCIVLVIRLSGLPSTIQLAVAPVKKLDRELLENSTILSQLSPASTVWVNLALRSMMICHPGWMLPRFVR